MKRILVYGSVFAMAFLITAGAVVMMNDNASALTRHCLRTLPCQPDDIYCTSNPCSWTPTCYPNRGAVFYCFPDWVTEYCSGDFYWPVPCSHQL